MLVVVTRLSPRGLPGLRAALALTGPVLDQLADLPGFSGGRLLVDRRLDLWTLTTWRDRTALSSFGRLHAPLAARVDEVAVASTTAAWQQEPDGLPGWSAVRARWTDGRGPARGLTRTLPAARATAGV